MSVKEDVAGLETNAMILGIVALSMKDFATQIIRHVNDGGLLDDAGFAALKAKCVRSLKNIAAQGMPLEQEATALNDALMMFGQMMDHVVSRSRAEGKIDQAVNGADSNSKARVFSSMLWASLPDRWTDIYATRCLVATSGPVKIKGSRDAIEKVIDFPMGKQQYRWRCH